MSKREQSGKQTGYDRKAPVKRGPGDVQRIQEEEPGKIARLKRHFQEEKEKLQGYSLKKKLEYILEYYWLWILGIVLAIAIPSYIIYHAVTAIKENWFFIVYTNTFDEAMGNNAELWKDFVAYGNYDVTRKNVQFINNCFFDLTKGSGAGNNYYQSFVVYVESGDLDAVTMGKAEIEALGRTGRLMDLEDERCKALLEKYQDRLIYAEPYDEELGKDLVPVGIDISDSILMTKYHLYPEDCALGVGAYSENLDAVEKYLEYILEE